MDHQDHQDHQGITMGIKMAINVQKILGRIKAIQVSDPGVLNTIDSFMDQTLEEISGWYQSGAIEWIKENKAFVWAELLALEDKINKAALKRDREALKGALAKYKALMLAMIREFSSRVDGSPGGCSTNKSSTPEETPVLKQKSHPEANMEASGGYERG